MDIKNAKKEQLPYGAILILPDGSEWYSEEYVREMMRREHSRGHRDGTRIEKHIAVIEMINQNE